MYFSSHSLGTHSPGLRQMSAIFLEANAYLARHTQLKSMESFWLGIGDQFLAGVFRCERHPDADLMAL